MTTKTLTKIFKEKLDVRNNLNKLFSVYSYTNFFSRSDLKKMIYYNPSVSSIFHALKMLSFFFVFSEVKP